MLALWLAATFTFFILTFRSGFVQEIVPHVDESTFAAYLKARERAHEAKLSRQHEAQMRAYKQRVEKVLRDSITAPRNHIIEDILTLRCPRPDCRAAFVDFDGCLALVCHACKCGFCGVCMADCGADAHDHVRQCAYANTGGRAHASTEDIPRMQNAWRLDRLREFLAPLQADLPPARGAVAVAGAQGHAAADGGAPWWRRGWRNGARAHAAGPQVYACLTQSAYHSARVTCDLLKEGTRQRSVDWQRHKGC